jgi:hypothetical protein
MTNAGVRKEEGVQERVLEKQKVKKEERGMGWRQEE